MSEQEERTWRGVMNRLAVKARAAEDSLQRALDGLEDRPADWTSGDYVNGQVDRAHDAVIDIVSALSARGFPSADPQ